MGNSKWFKISGGKEYLNIDTGAMLRAKVKWDTAQWEWIPCVEHQMGETKRDVFDGKGIHEKLHCWFEETKDQRAAMCVAIDELEKFMEHKMTDIQKEILDEIKRLYVDCPDCASMGSDDQYTCTTCWCEGGNGTINAFGWMVENWENIKTEDTNG